jgi:hypothetical protein
MGEILVANKVFTAFSGGLLVLFVILSYIMKSEWLLLIPAAMGVMQIQSAITGWCPGRIIAEMIFKK